MINSLISFLGGISHDETEIFETDWKIWELEYRETTIYVVPHDEISHSTI